MRIPTFIILFCAFSAQAATTVNYKSSEIRAMPLLEPAKAESTALPREVVFELAGPPQVVNGTLLRLEGRLTNPLDRPLQLITFGGNQIDPFSLQPIGEGNFQWSARHPLEPPAPAPTVVWDIPARSSIAYEAWFDLGRLDYAGTPRIRFEWRFGFSRQREPQKGIVAVDLPARKIPADCPVPPCGQ